ncbi:MAG: serine/threonine-protein phosphatase [Chloroflexi bacterium]|nr:serine/threonine-protein phosphatase [Chloroflexota bacterium]
MIPVDKAHLKVSAYSHSGASGQRNEDRYALEAYQLNDAESTGSVLALVADGVGANRAGEVAAQLAVETIAQALGRSDASQPTAILQAAIIQAGQTTLAQAETKETWQGMGSTCLCAWVVGRKLYTASVGNSRLYLLRGQRLRQLNIAHELSVDKKEDKTEARGGGPEERRGFLGGQKRVEVDLALVLRPGGEAKAARNQGMRLEANDRLLLCTDGLSDALDEIEIADLLGHSQLEETAEALVAAGLKKQAPGNLTALVLGVPPARPMMGRRGVAWRKLAVTSTAAVILVLLSLLGWFFWGDALNPNSTPRATGIPTLTAVPTLTTELISVE